MSNTPAAASRKRKAVVDLQIIRAKAPRKTDQPFVAAPMPDGRSLILELAAELRIRVYDMVLEDDPPKLARSTAIKQLSTASGLLKVNKQVHSELFAHLYQGTATIQTYVRDYDFSHIGAFFDCLANNDLKQIAPVCKEKKPATRGLEVQLVWGGGWTTLELQQEAFQNLRCWLGASQAEKSGVGFNVFYKAAFDYRPGLAILHRALRYFKQELLPYTEGLKVHEAIQGKQG